MPCPSASSPSVKEVPSQVLYERSRSVSRGHNLGSRCSGMGVERLIRAICVNVGGRLNNVDEERVVLRSMRVDGGTIGSVSSVSQSQFTSVDPVLSMLGTLVVSEGS